MFILHVDLTAKQGLTDALTTTYRDIFCPAIREQPGFSGTKLLRARSADIRTHRLEIVFENEATQTQWGATDCHREVWAKMERNISRYSVDLFETD